MKEAENDSAFSALVPNGFRDAHVPQRRANRWSSIVSSPPWRISWLLLLVTTNLLLTIASVEAVPSTSVSPASFFVGGAAGELFGTSVDCNAATELNTPRSLIAVGAPGAAASPSTAASGRVYIIDPSDSSGATTRQIIEPPSPQAGGEFGKAVAFIPDFNGDGLSDLAIAQPGGSSGTVFFFQSTPSTDREGASFSLCGATSSTAYFGEVLAPLRTPGSAGPTLLIGSPRSSPPSAKGVSISSSGSSCTVNDHAAFSITAAANSQFGSSLAFITDHDNPADGLPEMVVGAPRQGGAQNLGGSVFLAYSASGNFSVPPTPTAGATPTISDTPVGQSIAGASLVALGAATDLLGSALASSETTPIFAASAPGALNGIGRVSLYSIGGTQLCAFSPSLSEPSVAFGQTIAHLGATFTNLTNGSDFTVASYHSEAETGGMVALFGMNTTTSTCTQSFVKLNNCVRQINQRQGASLGGGSRCALIHNGASRSFVMVGSPGFTNAVGRIDLYVEGVGEHGAQKECAEGTSSNTTPVADATNSPAPSATNGVTDSTPTNTPTPTPTSTPDVGRGLDIYPNYDDLPEPKVETVPPSKVIISLPQVSPRFESKSYSRALKKLVRAGLSPSQASKEMERVLFTYIVTIEPISSVQTRGIMKKGFMAPSRSPSKVRIRSRKNRVSARLLPSTSYSISYVVEFYVTKPKRIVLGTTKKSAPTRVRLP